MVTHSGSSAIGLIAFIERLRRRAELLRLFFFPPILGRLGAEKTTAGGCWVASQGISGVASVIPVGTRMPSHKSNSSRSRRSSSEMRELAWPLPAEMWLKLDAFADRKSPAGHEGYAQMTVSGDTNDDGGVNGERERPEDVREGGESRDLGGIRMGFVKLGEHVSEGGEGESDLSLLASLPLSSESIMMLHILSLSRQEVEVDEGGVEKG